MGTSLHIGGLDTVNNKMDVESVKNGEYDDVEKSAGLYGN